MSTDPPPTNPAAGAIRDRQIRNQRPRHQQINFFMRRDKHPSQFDSDQEDNNMSTISLIAFIITLLHSTSAEEEQDLSLRSNPGLHAFTYYGSFADDISFGQLSLSTPCR